MDVYNWLLSSCCSFMVSISGFGRSPDSAFDPLERLDDDWRHVETVSMILIYMWIQVNRIVKTYQFKNTT